MEFNVILDTQVTSD